jgi:hypothetical protein
MQVSHRNIQPVFSLVSSFYQNRYEKVEEFNQTTLAFLQRHTS